MHCHKIPYNQDFILPNGNQGFAPGMIGDPKDDVNCRCFYVADAADDNMSRKISISGFDFDDEDGIMDSSQGENMNRLPKIDEAVISIEKFTKYCLDPKADRDKAIAFKEALGYNLDNANRLIANIRHNLPYYPAKPKGDLGYGMRYEVIMNLTGPNGKTAKVLTAWIDDAKNGQMRLTTAHVDK